MNTEREWAHAEHDRRIANVVLFGTIAAVDAAAGRASVSVEDGWTTDLLPWIETRAGASMRTWSAPDMGEQVAVLCASGEPGVGVVLRGVASAANPAAGSDPQVVVLGLWSDQASDQYDLRRHVRTLTLPPGGELLVIAGGATSLQVSDGAAILRQGAVQLVMQGGAVQVTGASSIALGAGGKPVARVGDSVDLHSGLIVSGSGVVTAA